MFGRYRYLDLESDVKKKGIKDEVKKYSVISP